MENKEIKKITNEMREQLRKPFPEKAISKIDSKSYLSSIKAIYVIERLNDVFGIGMWNLEHEVIKDDTNEVLIRGELVLLEYPILKIPKQFGSHKKEGKGMELADGYKSAVTDCLSKCASYLEIGIDVFKGIQTHNNPTPPTPALTFDSIKKELELAKSYDELMKIYSKFKSQLITDKNLNQKVLDFCKEFKKNFEVKS